MQFKTNETIAHPVGEASNGTNHGTTHETKCESTGGPGVTTAWPLDTPGGRYYAEWDPEAPVTVHGQLIFFVQFLQTGKRWADFIKDCPLTYSGNRGSGATNVIVTMVLSILSGHWRYLHMNAIRGDTINAGLLGATRLVSDDVVRDALNHRMDEEKTLAWIHQHQRLALEPILRVPYILDIDSTVKPLYGNQQGAEIGYNPQKPGRPSHVYHSYFVANLRLCLGVEVLGGKQHSSAHGQPGLWDTLKAYPRECWPTFVRGDCAYGNEAFMLECEENNMPYLFKLRFTGNVKKLVASVMHKGEKWKSDGRGWQVCEATIKLKGWSKERRVVLVREASPRAPIAENPDHVSSPGKRKGKDRDCFEAAEGKAWKSPAPWAGKISVLVTSLDMTDYPTESIGQLYRERGDMENNYDELKNQWGWNGYTTKKLGPCRIMANLIAFIANLWTLYVMLFDGEHHREAITSRPALLSGVGRQTEHAGKKTIKVRILHENGEIIAQAITVISNLLNRMSAIAARWEPATSWALLMMWIFRAKLAGKWLIELPPEGRAFLAG